MPLNKFTTLLDLARQAKILTGETATFDGKIQVGIPFSGYPTGVDTGSTVSLGVVSSEDAIFSGNTGTTVFDVSNPSSPNYNILFSGYTASTWSNPLFSANTSGLTLPITIFSADTQIVGPFWTLTQTGMTGDYVIGIQYTGYNLTYSFNEVLQIGTGITTQYSGFTTATQENFSAGTLDYKGPLDYLSTKEDATVEGRLITDKITITGGASSATTNYILAQTDDTGNGEWNSLSSLLSGTCHPLINLEVISGCSINGLTIESDVTVNGDVVINGSATTINTEIIQSKDNNIVLNYSGTHLTAIGGGITLEDGVSNGVDSTIYTNSDGVWLFDPSLSANNGTIDYLITNSLTANTIGDSGNCVSDLYVSNIHSCSPLNINPLDEGDVYFGSTSGVTIDVGGNIHINNTYGTLDTSFGLPGISSFNISGVSTNATSFGVSSPGVGNLSIGIRGSGETGPFSPAAGKQGDGYIYSSIDNNGLNLVSQPTFPQTTDDYIRFFAGQGAGAAGIADIHIQGSGATRGYVALGHGTPTEKLDVLGSIKMVDGNEQNGYVLTSDVNGVGSWQAAISGDTTYWTAGTGTDSAVLIGGGNIASGITSVAEGTNTVAGGDYSHAEGNGTKAFGGSSHAEGRLTTASGQFSHAEGLLTIASGTGAHSEGDGTVASGDNSHAEGLGSTSSGDDSHAEGIGTTSSGLASHAEGDSTIASGQYSHAEGRNTVASGFTSHAEGDSTIASGQYSHAEGRNTVASGFISHAEGYVTTASGSQSHAGGIGSIASNNNSHASGRNSLASGVESFNHSNNDDSINFGARGTHSAILGGLNNLISSATTNTVIIGGDTITAVTDNMVYVPDLNIVNCPSYDDDTAAGVGGLLVGEVFQTTGAGGAPLNVAGILMIKQ